MSALQGSTTPLTTSLERVRAGARRVLVLSAVCWVVAAAATWILGAAGIDYLLRMPAWMRCVLLALGLAGLAAAVLRWVVPALRFRPGLTEVALRLERTPEAAAAGLSGLLASGLELAEEKPGTPVTSWMSGQVVERAAARSAGLRAGALVKRELLRDSAVVLALSLSLVLGATAFVGPAVARIGAARVLAPWSGAAWPKRTQVADATAVSVHALGTTLPLRAVVVRTDREPGQTRVEARYRVVSGGERGPVQVAVLTGQGESERGGGEMYERLIEPAGLLPGGTEAAELEYWFQSSDDRTEPATIRLATPPSILSTRAVVTPPAYAAGASASFASGARDLGTGDDRRAVVGPVLAGSSVELELGLSKPVPAPSGEAAIAATLPGLTGATHEFGATTWRARWTLEHSTRVPVVVTDEYGLRSADAPAFAFDVVEDRGPTAAITEPVQDEAVLPTAVLPATGEGRDDVGVASVRVEAQPARRAAGSVGAAAEAAGEPKVVGEAARRRGSEAGVQGGSEAGTAERMVATGTVTLGDFALSPGDELWLTAVVTDAYERDGDRHAAARSPVRKLRVISADQMVEQVRGELSRLRESAIRLESEQAELQGAISERGAVSDDERRRQAGLSQRLVQQQEEMRGLQERIERNRLEDDALGGTIRDAADQLAGAKDASERAAASADRAAAEKPADEPLVELTPEQGAEIGASQQQVREELSRLIEMLDRGQDSWAVRRDIQRLLDQQRALMAQTKNAGERTTGRDMSELSPGERAELERIAAEQKELARRTDQALDKLSERARQMKEVDASQAAAMQQAAERGRQQQVPQSMEKASQNAGQNQTGAAQEQQQEAVESMEEMLDEMENAERNRDEALRRMLASLIESLDGLIRQQEDALAALSIARGTRDFLGLDAGMMRLNQNTLGVLGESKAAFREMEEVSRLVEAAAADQGAAVKRLRAIEDEEAEGHEQESLRNLQRARAEAQQLQDEATQRDQDKKRQELRKVYREALERQVVLRDETAPMLGVQLDRRQRMALRGLGEQQDAIRDSLSDLRKRTEELDEAVVFELAHQRLDAVTGGAAKQLRAGEGSPAVGRQQDAAVRILQALVEALSQDADKGDDFKDSESGGEEGGGPGGGQPSPLIPDLAEVRLLRGLQVQAAELTRALDEGAPDAAEVAELARFQESLAEKGQALLERIHQNNGPQPGGEP